MKTEKMMHNKWELLRCIYDEMGQYAIEREYCGLPDRFETALAKGYGEVGWIIGIPITHPGGITVKVILEGEKEVLEHILKLVKRVDREDEEAELNQSRRLGCPFDSV